MTNSIQSIALDKLVAHPDNPNQQSKVNFAKLVRNIEWTGRYEPLIVRPCPDNTGLYQIINGHHRCHALTKLGYKAAECIVWDIDDEQTDILLATLNRLSGSDQLGKKLKLLKRLNSRLESGELAKLIPQTRKQIERLSNLRMPSLPAKINAKSSVNPMVFFLDDRRQQVVEKALSLAEQNNSAIAGKAGTKAAKRSAALTYMAQHLLGTPPVNSGRFQ
jgi:ParB/RepB/Spo0J family partition protein